MRSSVRGGVGGRRRAAHVRGQSPGQGGEDGLKAAGAPPCAKPKAKPSLKTEQQTLKQNSGLFFFFFFRNIKLNRVNISSTRGAIEGRRANEVCRTQRRRRPSLTLSTKQP